MAEIIAKDVQEKIKKGEQVMPVKRAIEIPEITARQYVTSETGEVLPSTVSRYLSELVEATRRYYKLQGPTDSPEVAEMKRSFLNALIGDYYNKFHSVREVDIKKELLGKLEEQVLGLVGEQKMPQFSAKSSLITDPNDPHKARFPTLYSRLDEKQSKVLEEEMKKGITVKEAYQKHLKSGVDDSVTSQNYLARFLRDLVAGPVIYTKDLQRLGETVTKDISSGLEKGYQIKDLIPEKKLDSLLSNFRQYEVTRDERGKASGYMSKGAMDIQYAEIRRNLQAYYDELQRMVYGRGFISDVALKKKVPALYLTAQQRPYDVENEIKQAIEKVTKYEKLIPESDKLLERLKESLATVQKFKEEHPSQFVQRGEVRIGERDLRELQKAGMASPELQKEVDEVYALINRQPSTDEFSYKAMKLKVDDFLKDLSGVAIVPGLPVGDHPVMESMEMANKALEDLRENKLKELEGEFKKSGGSLTTRAKGLQGDIAEIDSLAKNLRPLYHEASLKLDYDGDMLAVHAARLKEHNEELGRVYKMQLEDYGDTRRALHEETSYVGEKSRSMGAKGAKLSPDEMQMLGLGRRASSPVWNDMNFVDEVSKKAKRNLLDVYSTAPDVIAEDSLKHFVHKIEMGQGYEAFNRIGFLYRGANAKDLGISPKMHETYNVLLGEFLRGVIQKVIGGKHGSAGSELSPLVQQAFFTGNVEQLMGTEASELPGKEKKLRRVQNQTFEAHVKRTTTDRGRGFGAGKRRQQRRTDRSNC